MARKKLSSNFQWGSTGRGKGTKTFVIKVRGERGKGPKDKEGNPTTATKSVNVRCKKGSPTEACQVAERLTAKAMESIADAQETDEARKRANLKAQARKRSKGLEKAPF